MTWRRKLRSGLYWRNMTSFEIVYDSGKRSNASWYQLPYGSLPWASAQARCYYDGLDGV